MSGTKGPEEGPTRAFSAAEIGALAHLYRGEVYRSTVWRTRLDTTTNWSVVTLGVALSITFSSTQASPLPLVLVGVLVLFFLMLEARRYRYFNVWRARARWMETHFYAPMLHEGDLHTETGWQEVLANDYWRPRYHVALWIAVGRRMRRNYIWILLIQSAAYAGKIVVHPEPPTALADIWARAAVGPVPGEVMIFGGVVYVAAWVSACAITWRLDPAKRRHSTGDTSMG
ncbi:DUF2270 domain-containing protein [Albimonas sp. CAU 1670]|uniref:DUF2270 domain-containing protein n=1 Tax=Albimonas sp. CAU 1670 TaxID=3032599 RepID=UPI0023D994B8|nr:DUF2270 domain-containing protein [Albimonas sp. CAU 1670]MDF2231732.1 DUF2270 domain-containing protein [Albimonas sp. CAU 1670]